MENDNEARYEHTLFALGLVTAGLSDPQVRTRLAESLRAQRFDRGNMERLRALLDEVLKEG